MSKIFQPVCLNCVSPVKRNNLMAKVSWGEKEFLLYYLGTKKNFFLLWLKLFRNVVKTPFCILYIGTFFEVFFENKLNLHVLFGRGPKNFLSSGKIMRRGCQICILRVQKLIFWGKEFFLKKCQSHFLEIKWNNFALVSKIFQPGCLNCILPVENNSLMGKVFCGGKYFLHQTIIFDRQNAV